MIGSDNGSAPVRRRAIILTNHDLSSIELLQINFNEIQIKTRKFQETALKNIVC